MIDSPTPFFVPLRVRSERPTPAMSEYTMGVAAFGNVTVEAESDEQAAKKLQAALYDLDSGDLQSVTPSHVNIDNDRRWEEGEIRERGISP